MTAPRPHDPRPHDQRAIIDRRALAEGIAAAVGRAGSGPAARGEVVALLKAALVAGRAAMERRLAATPSAGHAVAAGYAFLVDQLVRLMHDFAARHLYPGGNPTPGSRLAIVAVGGYGRSELAPRSDIDIAFLVGERRNAHAEQMVEAILYLMWDLGLTVGHSVRTLDEGIRQARADLTIRTALLEGRFVWGDRPLFNEGQARFLREVVRGNERAFVTEKLAERNARHRRMGDSRYVVEPNVKDGKGGLRDLQTLYWIGKFLHRVRVAADLVEAGLMTQAEHRGFRRAERFLLAVRAHMHVATGRAEDRLTFDLQREVARRMRFTDRPGKSAVERFMQFYFLQARRVGSLTGVFLAHIDDELATRAARGGFFAAFRQRARTVRGYRVFGGRIAAPADDWFRADPVRLLEVFQIAEAEGLEIHPDTMRLATRDAKCVDRVRDDPRANAVFLHLLTGRRDPETVLRWLNESGVFGRFVPDFGRVGAQMQFDMYHHYTVDEHTIRAIGLLSRIERGELAVDHPRATRLVQQVASRRVAYVAALLHDIAKGRGGDHSVLGAEIAEALCPRLGLDAEETALVAWLVRHHLLMSRTAQKRDLADPKTIADFVATVQGAERLRHLTILTAVDIRAVGPGTWNSWKGQLLGTLYDAASEMLRLGHMRQGRAETVAARRAAVAATDPDLVARLGDHFSDAYWIAEPHDVVAANLEQYEALLEEGRQLSVQSLPYPRRGATLVSVAATDVPGLFARIAGGIHLAGGNVIDARVHTTTSGFAIDNFLVLDAGGQPFGADAVSPREPARLERCIADAVAGRIDLAPSLARRRPIAPRTAAFEVRPEVAFDNKASNRFTVIEVGARDRPALLYRLAQVLFEHGLVLHSAHVATYGERAVDVFYVTDHAGGKLLPGKRLETVRAALHGVGDAIEAQLVDA